LLPEEMLVPFDVEFTLPKQTLKMAQVFKLEELEPRVIGQTLLCSEHN